MNTPTNPNADLVRGVLEVSDKALDLAGASLDLVTTLLDCLASDFRPTPEWIAEHKAVQVEGAASVATLRAEIERFYLAL